MPVETAKRLESRLVVNEERSGPTDLRVEWPLRCSYRITLQQSLLFQTVNSELPAGSRQATSSVGRIGADQTGVVIAVFETPFGDPYSAIFNKYGRDC